MHAERFLNRHAGSYIGLERLALGWTEEGKLFVSGSGLAVLDVCPALRDMEVTGWQRMCRSRTVHVSLSLPSAFVACLTVNQLRSFKPNCAHNLS